MSDNIITMKRGDTNSITVTVTDANEDAFDLTDYDMRFTVKDNATDSDALAKIGPKDATIVAPATGIGVIPITMAESNLKSKSYIYDVQITKGTTDNFTIIVDDFIITNDVTKETS